MHHDLIRTNIYKLIFWQGRHNTLHHTHTGRQPDSGSAFLSCENVSDCRSDLCEVYHPSSGGGRGRSVSMEFRLPSSRPSLQIRSHASVHTAAGYEYQ